MAFRRSNSRVDMFGNLVNTKQFESELCIIYDKDYFSYWSIKIHPTWSSVKPPIRMLGALWPGSWPSSSRPRRTTPTRRWWSLTSPASGDSSTLLSRSPGPMSSGIKLKSSRTIQWDLKTSEIHWFNLFSSTDSQSLWPSIIVFSATFRYQNDAWQTCSY